MTSFTCAIGAISARGVTLLRCWLIGLLLIGTPGMLPAQSAGVPALASAIQIVIELEDDPAVVIYQATQQLHWPATTAAQMSRAQITRSEAAQQDLLAALRPLNAILLYRAQRVYNGSAARIDARDLDAIRRLPGVNTYPQVARQLAQRSSDRGTTGVGSYRPQRKPCFTSRRAIALSAQVALILIPAQQTLRFFMKVCDITVAMGYLT